jgi:hypothetical protein
MRTRFPTLLSLIFILLTPLANARAQEHASVVQSKYSQVIQRVFQFSRGVPAEFQGVSHRVVVRFLPSFDRPESQIVLLKKDDGAVRIIHYRLKGGMGSVSATCNEILDKNPQAEVDDIVKQVGIDRVELPADSSTIQLLDRLLSLSIPAKLDSSLFTADGTNYELWIQTPQNGIHAVFSEGAYGVDTDSVPIIQWIKAVWTRFQPQKKD